MIDSCFEQWAENPVELYPATRQQEIDWLIRDFETEFTRPTLIAGSTKDQNEYERVVRQLFAWFEHKEALLDQQRYLAGNTISLVDLVVFTGLVRFDSVYHGGCLCNIRRVQDLPNLWAYTRDIYQLPGVAATVDIESYRQSFFLRSPVVPRRIVPLGPEIDFDLPQDRGERFN
jgi:putative glutathione S-transferase